VEHADTDVIVSVDDLYKELVPTWMGDDFDPEAMNAATGNAFDRRHHVKGEGAKSKADFKNIILAFCLEHRDVIYRGEKYRVRCLNTFNVLSNQCTTHGRTVFKDGSNAIFQRMLAGEEVTYGEIRDRRVPETAEAPQTPEQIKQAAKAAAKDELAKVNEAISEAFNNDAEVDNLFARQAELQSFLSGRIKTLKAAPTLVQNQDEAGEVQNEEPHVPVGPVAPVASSYAIYNSRTTVNNSKPGKEDLDRMYAEMQNRNNAKGRGTKRAQLQQIDETLYGTKKGKKNKQPTPGST
jgi:hypothetical protein